MDLSGIDNSGDLILFNGKIITVDPNDTIAEAIAIKDGKIVGIGVYSDVKSLVRDGTKPIDLEGKTVVPGFIDAHVHLDCMATHTKLALSCHIPTVKYIETNGAVECLADILKALKEKVQQTAKGQWIIAQGRFTLESDGNCPTRKQLDEIAPDHPIMIRYNAHTHLLNSNALKLVEITKDGPDQEELEKYAAGAKVLRDPASGEPTGKLIECGDWIFPMHNPFPHDRLKGAIRKACRETVSFGITSIQEFTSWPESTRIYQELYRNGELPLRVQLCPTVWGLYKTIDLDCIIKLGLQTGFGDERLKFGRAKIFVDVAGYDVGGQPITWPRITQDKLNELVFKAHRAGIAVMMHATSRDGQNMALNAVEQAVNELPDMNHRARIEHFAGDYWPEGIERMKRLKMIPVPTPYSSLGWYGDAWLESAQPGEKAVIYRTLLNEGLMPPGNSDGMGTEPEALNPWWSIWCLVARKTRRGRSICPEEGVTVMEAIRIYTLYSAHAGFEEHIKGSLEVGKLADMAVLSEDPLCVAPQKLPEIKADLTIVEGKIVYNRELSE
ncbi:MAG: amidohydrolase [bacterium]|nr:amidohydrolase [bacterium]